MADSDAQTFKFPPFQPDLLPTHEEEPFAFSSSRGGSPNRAAEHIVKGHHWRPPGGLWDPARSKTQGGRTAWAPNKTAATPMATRHSRQKSLSEAIRTIRTRKGSMSQNAHEVVDALKAPLSWKLIVRLFHPAWRVTDMEY